MYCIYCSACMSAVIDFLLGDSETSHSSNTTTTRPTGTAVCFSELKSSRHWIQLRSRNRSRRLRGPNSTQTADTTTRRDKWPYNLSPRNAACPVTRKCWMSHVVAHRVIYLPSHFICPGDGWMSHAVAHRVTYLPSHFICPGDSNSARERASDRTKSATCKLFFCKTVIY